MKRTFEIKTVTEGIRFMECFYYELKNASAPLHAIIMDDKEWKASQKRSNPMNAMFHAWMVEISKAWNFHKLETEPPISPEGFKVFFKKMFLGDEEIATPRGIETVHKRTRDLSKQEFTVFLNDIENYVRAEMSDYGINLDRGV